MLSQPHAVRHVHCDHCSFGIPAIAGHGLDRGTLGCRASRLCFRLLSWMVGREDCLTTWQLEAMIQRRITNHYFIPQQHEAHRQS